MRFATRLQMPAQSEYDIPEIQDLIESMCANCPVNPSVQRAIELTSVIGAWPGLNGNCRADKADGGCGMMPREVEGFEWRVGGIRFRGSRAVLRQDPHPQDGI